MADQVLSMSMSGKGFCLCGKSYYRCRGPETLTKDLKRDEVPEYVTLGTDGSWYRCFKVKDNDPKKPESHAIARSPNFTHRYPSLDKHLDEHKLFTPPDCLSLGPSGHYFAHIGNKKLWKLPVATETALGDLKEYEAVWLGAGEAYVGVRKGGGMSMDLKGKYEGLKEAIRAHGAPKVVAMNAEDEAEWVAVWPNGKYSRRSGRTSLPSEDANTFFEKLGFNTK